MKGSLIYTKRLTVCAALCALSFVFMYLGTLTGVMDLCAVAVGALFCAFAVIEMGGVWPWLVFSVTSVLCLLLLPDKFCALEYAVLGGIYPILKAYFERLRRLVSYPLKILSFNLLLTLSLLLANFLFGIKDSWASLSLVVYIVANCFFLFFDYALTVFISYYLKRIRPRLHLNI